MNKTIRYIVEQERLMNDLISSITFNLSAYSEKHRKLQILSLLPGDWKKDMDCNTELSILYDRLFQRSCNCERELKHTRSELFKFNRKWSWFDGVKPSMTGIPTTLTMSAMIMNMYEGKDPLRLLNIKGPH